VITNLSGALLSLALVAAEPLPIGSSVYDPQGNVVGTIQSVQPDAVVLLVGSDKITLGLSSFRTRDGRLMIGLSRQALEAANARIQQNGDAEVRPLLTAGASIYDENGAVAGTVTAVDGDRISIKVDTITATFPISAFSKGPKGPQIKGNAADFSAGLKARLPAQPPFPKPAQVQPVPASAPPQLHQ
jgi:hypothetical protein